MAIKTTWTVEHACGHEQDHDLSDKRPSERAGFARWLKTKDCSDCWRATRDKQNATAREAWVEEQRAKEMTEVEAWELVCAMPVLDGSDKSVDWGRRVRHNLMAAGHDYAQEIGVCDEDFAQQVEQPARRINSASWWIDQRDAEGDDLPELVQDGAFQPAAPTGLENPY